MNYRLDSPFRPVHAQLTHGPGKAGFSRRLIEQGVRFVEGSHILNFLNGTGHANLHDGDRPVPITDQGMPLKELFG